MIEANSSTQVSADLRKQKTKYSPPKFQIWNFAKNDDVICTSPAYSDGDVYADDLNDWFNITLN